MPNQPPPSILPGVLKNIESVALLEQQFRQQRSRMDGLSDAVSAFAGSARFIVVHAVLFGLWIAWNLFLPEWLRFDPSFSFFQVWSAVEALFLSAFVLMSQGRQGRLAEHWAQVTLQVGLLTEQEMTKMLQLQQRVVTCLGLDRADAQLAQMIRPTDVNALVQEVGKAREVTEVLAVEVEKVARAGDALADEAKKMARTGEALAGEAGEVARAGEVLAQEAEKLAQETEKARAAEKPPAVEKEEGRASTDPPA